MLWNSAEVEPKKYNLE